MVNEGVKKEDIVRYIKGQDWEQLS